jgi:hypothetical protein
LRFEKQKIKMEGDLEKETSKLIQLQIKLEHAKKESEQIRQEINLFESAASNGVFYMEAQRAKKVSIWWIIFTLAPLLCMFGTKGVVTPGLNFFAFLCMWRGLYVKINRIPVIIAVVIVVFTIKFG